MRLHSAFGPHPGNADIFSQTLSSIILVRSAPSSPAVDKIVLRGVCLYKTTLPIALGGLDWEDDGKVRNGILAMIGARIGGTNGIA